MDSRWWAQVAADRVGGEGSARAPEARPMVAAIARRGTNLHDVAGAAVDELIAITDGARRAARRGRRIVRFVDRFSVRHSARACAAAADLLQVLQLAAEVSELSLRALGRAELADPRIRDRLTTIVSVTNRLLASMPSSPAQRDSGSARR